MDRLDDIRLAFRVRLRRLLLLLALQSGSSFLDAIILEILERLMLRFEGQKGGGNGRSSVQPRRDPVRQNPETLLQTIVRILVPLGGGLLPGCLSVAQHEPIGFGVDRHEWHTPLVKELIDSGMPNRHDDLPDGDGLAGLLANVLRHLLLRRLHGLEVTLEEETARSLPDDVGMGGRVGVVRRLDREKLNRGFDRGRERRGTSLDCLLLLLLRCFDDLRFLDSALGCISHCVSP